MIGRALIPKLLERGNTVRILSRNASIERERYAEAVEAVDADISDAAELGEAADDCEAVIHLAGIVDERPPSLTFELVNVDGTRHLLEAAERAGRPLFVQVSSLGADRGSSAYHRSKYAAEALVRDYAGPWVILRPGNVYGPGDETVSRLLLLARRFSAVPMIGDGRQPFQPVWHRDLAEIIAQTLDRPEFTGRVLEIAGPELTTTEDLMRRFAAITGRKPARIGVSPRVAGWGAATLDAFGGKGRRWLSRNGLPTPLTSSKLDLLLEGNVIAPDSENAIEAFRLTPTLLQEGLAELVRSLPEQLPGAGVGAVAHTAYWVDIDDARVEAADLLEWICRHLADLMPVVVEAASPGVDIAEPGRVLNLRMPGGRAVQVRVIERTAVAVTFAAVEGHPMAGFVRFVSENAAPGIRFTVHVVAQPATAVERLASWPVGRFLQDVGWRNLVRHVVTLSGGRSRSGIRRRVYPKLHDETEELRAAVGELAAGQSTAAGVLQAAKA